ncbi:hypothetical protein [Aquisphaera insulae]|uniref:hypothetical protein n=1 Tax=Aquisphaera insulae TaxID=2712864 RepID=UPI0013EADAA4|nr:hypothetical protein [Aquisphaera insulae]
MRQHRRPSTSWPASLLVLTVALLDSGPSRAHADTILETATLGANPTPAVGLGALQWVGARFSVSNSVDVDTVGANLQGAQSLFVAIVALDGPDGLPSWAPSQIESHALAHAVFTAPSAVADVSVSLPVALGPGDYGVVFGVGAFNSGGGANLTEGNIPTSQASFFSALNVVDDKWLDQPGWSGLRIFVTGTSAVPEPSSWLLVSTGLLVPFVGRITRSGTHRVLGFVSGG